MSGDYTRFTFDAAKLFSGVLMQQGRVQLDSDWNEGIDIFKERVRKLSLDVFGPVGVPTLVSPDAFLIGVLPGPPLDLSIGAGRLYVDGFMAENFDQAPPVTYLTQPFLPDPDPLPNANVSVWLDLWEREVTYIEDPELLDVALGGVDTTTRVQQVWQVRVQPSDATAQCGLELPQDFEPSAGRLTTEGIAPPTPDDPCVLPPIAGYRGLENRLYRLEIHEAGPVGTAKFRWSQTGGSIVSAVTAIAVSGATTRLTVNRIGRDRMLRFRIDDWVSVTDDHRELRGEPVDMARIVDIDEAARQIVVDRALAAFPTNPDDLAARHARIQRWDQRAPINALDGDGLMTTAAGPIDLEDGIRVSFDMEPANGTFRTGDYWLFPARTATAWVEPLDRAPPRGIKHTYVQLAAINGLGSANEVSDCRPKPEADCDCCCVTLRPDEGDYIQKAIDSLPDAGGCICLLPGIHRPRQTIVIRRSNITLKAESGGAVVRLEGEAPVLIIGDERAPVSDILVSRITFERVIGDTPPAIIMANAATKSAIEHCGIRNLRSAGSPGIMLSDCTTFRVAHCHLRHVYWGIVAAGRTSADLLFRRNRIELERANRDQRGIGIWMVGIEGGSTADENLISGPASGIVVSGGIGQMMAVAAISTTVATRFISVRSNFILCTPGTDDTPVPCFGIDLASDDSSACDNIIVMFARRAVDAAAIRLSGYDQRAVANRILGYGEAADTIGILIGDPKGQNWDVAASDNRISGCRTGIRANNASEVEISGNHISSETQAASATSGIIAEGIVSSEISDNDIRAVTAAINARAGRANRLSGNEISDCATGIWIEGEALPVIAQNRVEQGQSFGIGIARADLSCEVSGNHVDRCGFGEPVGLGIIAAGITGELSIKFNEVRDIGLDPSGASKSAVAIGIGGLVILTASVEGNFVTYTNLAARPVDAEDRALVMMGMSEFLLADRVFGFPITIGDNKFYGAGKSALVELRQTTLANLLVRFERVLFSNNYCFHVSGEPNDALATVVLCGRAATVMGNQVQATTRFFSFDFNGMPGPFMGNVMAGGVLQHPPFPADAFNMTI